MNFPYSSPDHAEVLKPLTERPESPLVEYLFATAERLGYRTGALAIKPRFKVPIYGVWNPELKRHFWVGRVNSYPDQSRQAFLISKDKHVMAHVLQQYNIPTIPTQFFENQAMLENYLETSPHERWVIKPYNGGMGEDIYFNDSRAEAQQRGDWFLEQHGAGIIQPFITGEDLRIQAVGGKLFAACRRVPAHVTGDGTHTIAELIKARNKIKMRKAKIVVNDDLKRFIKNQGLSLESIPANDQSVRLHEASNIGLGGDPVDVTDRLHPDYAVLVEHLADILSTRTLAVDILVDDVTLPFAESNPVVVEVNIPCMWVHHHFAQGQQRDVARAILDAHFYPESFDPNNPIYLL